MKTCMKQRLEKHISDQVKADRFTTEPGAVSAAVARLMLSDDRVEMSVDDIRASHDPSLPDHEKFLEAMLARRILQA